MAILTVLNDQFLVSNAFNGLRYKNIVFSTSDHVTFYYADADSIAFASLRIDGTNLSVDPDAENVFLSGTIQSLRLISEETGEDLATITGLNLQASDLGALIAAEDNYLPWEISQYAPNIMRFLMS